MLTHYMILPMYGMSSSHWLSWRRVGWFRATCPEMTRADPHCTGPVNEARGCCNSVRAQHLDVTKLRPHSRCRSLRDTSIQTKTCDTRVQRWPSGCIKRQRQAEQRGYSAALGASHYHSVHEKDSWRRWWLNSAVKTHKLNKPALASHLAR